MTCKVPAAKALSNWCEQLVSDPRNLLNHNDVYSAFILLPIDFRLSLFTTALRCSFPRNSMPTGREHRNLSPFACLTAFDGKVQVPIPTKLKTDSEIVDRIICQRGRPRVQVQSHNRARRCHVGYSRAPHF